MKADSKDPCPYCDPEGARPWIYGSLVKVGDYSRVIVGYITYLDFGAEHPRYVTECDSCCTEHAIHYCPECGRDLDA